MMTDATEKTFLRNFDPDRYRKPAVMVDVVIFSVQDN